MTQARLIFHASNFEGMDMGQRKGLTYYASPAMAPREKRVIARMALALLEQMARVRGAIDWDAVMSAAGRLMYWSAPVVLAVCRDERLRKEQLVSPEEWDELDFRALNPLLRSRTLLRRLISDSMRWIDSAADGPSDLERNVGFLAESICLTEAEQALVKLAGFARCSESLKTLLRVIQASSLNSVSRFLAGVLKVGTEDVMHALRPSGALARLGLVSRHIRGDCEDLVTNCEAENVYAAMQGHYADASAFLGGFLRKSTPATIQREDCAHLAGYLDVAVRLLGQALAGKEAGIHILLHGPAGTGKTEFARLLAAELGARLYEVEHEDVSGASAPLSQRFASMILGGQFLKGSRKALLLFDEAEDAFPKEQGVVLWLGEVNGKSAGYGKAWMNRLLEGIPVPVLWTANSTEGMDPAFLRRFSLHIRFPELPKSAKRRLTDHYLGGIELGEPVKDEIACLRGLTPGQLESARRVVTLCEPKDSSDSERIVRLQMGAARRVVGLDYAAAGADLPIPYSPEFVNLRAPMTVPLLREGLRTQKRAAVCLYGKPGTGKTQLAHYLAQALEREVVVKSASDLLSPWLGMTEKLIAEMFEDARERADEVVLLLDEADTFLRDRSGARESWEVSQTNEFLARMERFPGIFFCTTNLVTSLDPAVLRRFQFRIEFLSLRREQAARAFEATFGRAPGEGELSRLGEDLVPADFANVARQRHFLGSGAPAEPIDMLQEELLAREGMQHPKRAIGFTGEVQR